MSRFTDANGREWELNLDGPTIRAIRKEFDGLDLADNECSAVKKMEQDVCLLVDVIWFLCADQARPLSIIPKEFAKGLKGDVIEKATIALRDAIADFFPSQKRDLLKAMADKQLTINDLAMKRALEKINDPQLQAQAVAAIEERLDNEIKAHLTRLRNASDSPASAESTLAA